MPTKTVQKSWQMRMFTRTVEQGVWAAQQSRLVVSTNVSDTVTTGGSLPDYRRLISERKSATTSLNGTKYNLSGAHTQGSIRYQRSTTVSGQPYRVGSSASGCVGGASNIGILGLSTLSLTSANNQALGLFVSRAAKAQREVQLLVTAGELGETARYIRRRSQGLYNGFWSYLDAIKKRAKKIRRSRQIQEMIADAWLEYQFAIKPTISDIEDASRAVAKIMFGHSPSKRVIGQGNVDRNGTSGFHPDTLNNHWTVRRYYQYYELSNVRYTGSVSSSSMSVYKHLSTLGATPGEVLVSIWELMPWSFVVDYFTNIQELLESVRWHATDLDWCEKGTRRMTSCRVYDVQIIPVIPGGWKIDYCSVDPGVLPSSQRVDVTREKYAGALTPSLEFEIPGLSTKWLNLLALNRARRETSQAVRRIG
jgi:hypothetical protein